MRQVRDGRWIQQRLDELAAINQGGPIWRAPYTPEYAQATQLLTTWMKTAGLTVRQDPVGNLYGRLAGSDEHGPVVLAASHLDTVRDGGKYDGAAGVVTALAALANLREQYGRPRQTLEVGALIEEEGSRFPSGYLGSRAMMGKLTEADLAEADEQGISLREAMTQAGGAPAHLAAAKREDLAAYLELHIEQGPQLQREGKDIGIVEHIVGLDVWEVIIKGEQNHAGTTPMPGRRDPVVAASRLISDLTGQIGALSPRGVATVGQIQTIPGMSNVIAKEVRFTIDVRDGSADSLASFYQWLTQRLASCRQDGLATTLNALCREAPAAMDPQLTQRIEKQAERLQHSWLRMNSGAGHDAQVIAAAGIPTAMIFLPSQGGISHSPREFTEEKFLGKGCELLTQVLREVCYE